MLNTYPCNPFPISSEQLHKGDNEDLQAQINAIKDGSVIDSFGDVETALDTKADNDVIAPEFDAEAGTYEIGDLVMYEGKLYEFTSAHETAGEWDSTEVTEKTVADEIGTVKSGLTNVESNLNNFDKFLIATKSITLGSQQSGTVSFTPSDFSVPSGYSATWELPIVTAIGNWGAAVTFATSFNGGATSMADGLNVLVTAPTTGGNIDARVNVLIRLYKS